MKHRPKKKHWNFLPPESKPYFAIIYARLSMLSMFIGLLCIPTLIIVGGLERDAGFEIVPSLTITLIFVVVALHNIAKNSNQKSLIK